MWKKFLKFLFWVFIIALISAIVIGAFILLGRPEPLKEGGIVLAAIFSIWIVFILIRRLIIRMRAKAQVNRIINVDGSSADTELGLSQKQLLKELSKSWHKATSAIRKSQLKLKGNPLYVLPWYMVIGKPSSGKSTALKNAKLLLPEIDLPKQDEGSTLNLAWWLHEQAIVIDTAGRYAVPDEEKRDRKEWATLLDMLARHKQKEPINGLVVVVSAERLLNFDEEKLLEEGRQVRASINELMERLEIDVPIYLMVTKCDLIEGFSEWSEYLPASSKLQAMGVLKDEQGGDIHHIVDQSLDCVLDRLKELRLLMLERTQSANDCLLTLPAEMEKIRNGLHAFITSALKENPYQDTPNLRGLYFSSSQQAQNTTNSDTTELRDDGIFLNHIFTKVLPADRGLLNTLPSAERIRRAARTYALSIGGGMTLLAFIALSITFKHDIGQLEAISNTYTSINLQQKDISGRIYSLSQLQDLIQDMGSAQQEWVIPWLGSYGNTPQVNKIIMTYNDTFKEQVLSVIDPRLKSRIASLQGHDTSNLAGGLIRRINLLKTALNNNEGTSLEDIPAISKEYLIALNIDITPGAANLFNELYISYLETNAIVNMEEELDFLQNTLVALIQHNHGDFNWIIDWANQQGHDPVRLVDFWAGSIELQSPPMIKSAYTLQGRDFILAFVDELEAANDDSSHLGDIRSDFETFYERQYIDAWRQFAIRFNEGTNKLRDRKEWLFALERMSGKDNPYFTFMSRMHLELKPFDNAENLFESMTMVNYFKEMLDYAAPAAGGGGNNSALTKMALKIVGKAGKAGKLVSKVGKKGLKAKKKLSKGKGKDGAELTNVIEGSAKTLDAYKKALLDIAFSADSKSQSYTSTAALFSSPDNPGAGDGSSKAAWDAINSLQRLVGKPLPSNKTFWNLYNGPLQLAQAFMRKESSCHLQEKWSDDVLAGIEGVTVNNLGKTLFGDQGLVWAYIEGDAKPFLAKRHRMGYLASELNKHRIPWNPDFLTYINKASAGRFIVENEFTVMVSSLPTGVNIDAKISPYATFVTLHCADGVQELANYNYPGSTEFLWSLDKCGDTSLQIELGHIRLRKDYLGAKGFSHFLADFRDGRRIFSANEFPNQASQLKNEGVTAVDVNYEFSGQEPVIQMIEAVPLSPPTRVAQCW